MLVLIKIIILGNSKKMSFSYMFKFIIIGDTGN
jgi:hypothetical protein